MSIIIFIIVLSILIIVHEFGHFIVAKRMGVRVDEFSLGFGPKIFSWRRGTTEYLICAIPLGGYVKLAGDSPSEFKNQPDEYLSKSIRTRARIIFYGPLLNYVLAYFCFCLIFFIGFPRLGSSIGEVIDGFGAKDAGLMPKDKIVAVDNQRVEFWTDLQRLIHCRKETETVHLTVMRGSTQLNMPVRIKQKELETIFGERKSVGLIGIKPKEDFIITKYGPIQSFWQGGARLLSLTGLILRSLGWMIIGRTSIKESVTGPLGIFFITKEAADLGIVPLLNVVALLSMSLAIFNLLPLPVLDGGHLLFLFLEKIRKKRLSVRTEKIITQIGLSFILLLITFVFYNDLLRYGVFEKISAWWSG
ncbi:MAG: RIP metalloprotease RseP [Candidatus Omnitrophica bacterium]|nr:RIP metalloprotease RseP [Candidatus Omnitrophota bacterium]